MRGFLLVSLVVAPAFGGCSCASDGDVNFADASLDTSVGDAALDTSIDTLGRDGALPDTAPCPDMDMDGVTTCAGDCDDADALTYPGAPEVCGDGVANDCDPMAVPDMGCMGIGTYVAPPPVGDPANPGTQASPVDTIGQGIANAVTIGGGVDVYVAAGTYRENITLVEGVSLLGGYESTGWTRDPAMNVTTIRSGTHLGVLCPAGITRGTAIDGFGIDGQSGAGGSAAITIVDGSSPSITNNIIRAGNAGGTSVGVDVNPANNANAASPLIEGNQVNMGAGRSGWGPTRGSVGIRVRQTRVEILGNRVTIPDDPGTFQRGIFLAQSPAGTFVDGNRVRGTGASLAVSGISFRDGEGTINANEVSLGTCAGWCMGIDAGGELPNLVITNNVAFGGRSTASTNGRSIGLALFWERVPPVTPPNVVVHSNFFDGGGASPMSAGLALGENPTALIVVGRIRNNIIRSGAGTDRYAVFEDSANIDPELFENNALYVDPSGTPMNSALYRDEGATDLTTAATVNGVTGSAMNIADDCSVTRPVAGGDFHLMAGSNCLGAGSSIELPPVDFEGDPRPASGGPDIGPDES